MDFYRDYFTGEALMATLSEQPYTAGQVGKLGIFQTLPLPGTIMALETVRETEDALPVAVPRGTPGNALLVPRGDVKTFVTDHYKKGAAITPDEVLNQRNPGAMARQVLAQRQAQKLAGLRRDMDRLHEKQRIDILKAPAVSSDGQSLYGAAAAGQTIAFGVDGTKVRTEIHAKLIKTMETALGGLTYNGYTVLLSNAAWETLLDSPYMVKTYLNTPAAKELTGQLPTDELNLFGGRWIRYRGDSLIDLTANHAVVVPNGVQGLFYQGFAPADTADQVGAGVLGGPYYIEARAIDEGLRGWQMDIQTNVAMVCTRPGAVIDLTIS